MSVTEAGAAGQTVSWRRLAMAVTFGLLALTVTACDDGPAEEAGSEAGAAVDNAVDEAGDAAESAGDAIEDTAEDAADAVGDAAEDAGDAVEKKTE
jgi:hypothetical protein